MTLWEIYYVPNAQVRHSVNLNHVIGVGIFRVYAALKAIGGRMIPLQSLIMMQDQYEHMALVMMPSGAAITGLENIDELPAVADYWRDSILKLYESAKKHGQVNPSHDIPDSILRAFEDGTKGDNDG